MKVLILPLSSIELTVKLSSLQVVKVMSRLLGPSHMSEDIVSSSGKAPETGADLQTLSQCPLF